MKTFLFSVLVLCSLLCKSQDKIITSGKNIIHYKSERISEELSKIEDPLNPKIIYNRALGVDVNIYVDTVFKKYTITFKDKDDKLTAMVYSYVRDYFIDEKPQTPKTRMYLMKFQDIDFMLIDYITLPPFYLLEIRFDKSNTPNTQLLLRIKDIELAP